MKDYGNELGKPCCIVELGDTGFMLLMPSARIACVCVSTGDTLAVIELFIAKPL